MLIPENIRREMIRLAQKDRPVEACGYLAGQGDEVQVIIPMTNVDRSPEHFSFDPKEQFQAVKTARKQGLELIGVYHSHPASPARLSAEDIRLANDPGMIYSIISLAGPEPVVKAFRVHSGEIREVPITITEGAAHE
jgi:proteasome lid subunit RPN8/RPN11